MPLLPLVHKNTGDKSNSWNNIKTQVEDSQQLSLGTKRRRRNMLLRR